MPYEATIFGRIGATLDDGVDCAALVLSQHGFLRLAILDIEQNPVLERAQETVLNAIYEEDFLGISYGFRPGRGTHDALDALCVGIDSRKVSWILDADIQSFFDTVNQEWLIRFVEHRIGDRRITRLIRKWLKAGVLEDGIVTVSDWGTGLDLWAVRWRRREATGDMIIVRYADDCAPRRRKEEATM